MAEDLQAHGRQNVVVETIKDSGLYVDDEQPTIVAELIGHYGSMLKLENRTDQTGGLGRGGL